MPLCASLATPTLLLLSFRFMMRAKADSNAVPGDTLPLPAKNWEKQFTLERAKEEQVKVLHSIFPQNHLQHEKRTTETVCVCVRERDRHTGIFEGMSALFLYPSCLPALHILLASYVTYCLNQRTLQLAEEGTCQW